MPTEWESGPLLFAFSFAKDDKEPSVYVKGGENEAKFLLAPVSLQSNNGFSSNEINWIKRFIKRGLHLRNEDKYDIAKIERKIISKLQNSILVLYSPAGRTYFDTTIGSREQLGKFIKCLKTNKKDLISAGQSSEQNRKLVWEKFDKVAYYYDPDEWNSWRDYILECLEFFTGDVFIVEGKATDWINPFPSTLNYFPRPSKPKEGKKRKFAYMNLSTGVVGVLNGKREIENVKKMLQVAEDPPVFDLSGRFLGRKDLMGDFRGVNFNNMNLISTDFEFTNLAGNNMSLSNFGFANFKASILDNTNLTNSIIYCLKTESASFDNTDFSGSLILGVDFQNGNLPNAKFLRCCMPGINFQNANLVWGDLSGAFVKYGDLRGADLRGARLIETDLSWADISGAKVYGITPPWNANIDELIQKDLIVTRDGEPSLTVDNLTMAYEIYKSLENREIGRSIETWKDKCIVIFGNFKQKADVLDRIKSEVRKYNYISIVYDFSPPGNQPIIVETSTTLARLSKFVIFDLTYLSEPKVKITKEELIETVRGIPSVVIVPIIRKGFPIWDEFKPIFDANRNRILDPIEYEDAIDLISSFSEKIMAPAEEKVRELRAKP